VGKHGQKMGKRFQLSNFKNSIFPTPASLSFVSRASRAQRGTPYTTYRVFIPFKGVV